MARSYRDYGQAVASRQIAEPPLKPAQQTRSIGHTAHGQVLQNDAVRYPRQTPLTQSSAGSQRLPHDPQCVGSLLTS